MEVTFAGHAPTLKKKRKTLGSVKGKAGRENETGAPILLFFRNVIYLFPNTLLLCSNACHVSRERRGWCGGQIDRFPPIRSWFTSSHLFYQLLTFYQLLIVRNSPGERSAVGSLDLLKIQGRSNSREWNIMITLISLFENWFSSFTRHVYYIVYIIVVLLYSLNSYDEFMIIYTFCCAASLVLPRRRGPTRRCSFVNRVQGSLQSTGVQTNIPDRDWHCG